MKLLIIGGGNRAASPQIELPLCCQSSAKWSLRLPKTAITFEPTTISGFGNAYGLLPPAYNLKNHD